MRKNVKGALWEVGKSVSINLPAPRTDDSLSLLQCSAASSRYYSARRPRRPILAGVSWPLVGFV